MTGSRITAWSFPNLHGAGDSTINDLACPLHRIIHNFHIEAGQEIKESYHHPASIAGLLYEVLVLPVGLTTMEL